jgi:hypothetical protein
MLLGMLLDFNHHFRLAKAIGLWPLLAFDPSISNHAGQPQA